MSKYKANSNSVSWENNVYGRSFICSNPSDANMAAKELNRLHDENVKMQSVVDAAERVSNVDTAERASDLFRSDLLNGDAGLNTFNEMTKLRKAIKDFKPKTPEQLQQERNDAADAFLAVPVDSRDMANAKAKYLTAKKAHEQCENQQ